MLIKDGLPRRAFAYAPTADPETWRLPYRTADGSPDPVLLPAAASALAEADTVPAEFAPMVKAKLRAAYRRWKGSDVQYPDAIAESEEVEDRRIAESDQSFSEIIDSVSSALRQTLPPDKGTGPHSYTYPEAVYDGWLVARVEGPEGTCFQKRSWAIMDGEVTLGDPIEVARRTKWEAIKEAGEAGFPDEVTAWFTEVGKRNSATDSRRIQGVHDFVVELGAACSPVAESGSTDPDAAPVAEAEVTTFPQPAVTVTVRESAGDSDALCTLAEAGAVFDRENRIVTITPIKPGNGNKRDGFYYPAQTLKEATEGGLFNHLKMFRNHPRKSDSTDLPERSVTDWFATTQEATWDEVRQVPRVPIKVHDDADFRRFEDAPEQIAFSVLGGGKARPGKVNGEEKRIVESFVNLRSVDWVTTAGAGGAIDFAESATEEFEMEFADLTAEKLAEARPDLIKAIREAADDKPEGDEKPEAKGDEKPAASAPAGTVPAPEGFVSKSEFDALSARLDRMTAAPEAAKKAAEVVATAVAESTLPGHAKDAITAQFAEATVGAGMDYATDAVLTSAVAAQLSLAQRLLGTRSGAPRGTGGVGGPADGSADVREAARDRITARYDSATERIPKATPHTFGPGGLVAIGESTAAAPKDAADRIADRL